VRLQQHVAVPQHRNDSIRKVTEPMTHLGRLHRPLDQVDPFRG
jgi:hypothetical protein